MVCQTGPNLFLPKGHYWVDSDLSRLFIEYSYMGVSENVVYPEKPNGFVDHYPYEKWLFHWEYTLFSDKPIYVMVIMM